MSQDISFYLPLEFEYAALQTRRKTILFTTTSQNHQTKIYLSIQLHPLPALEEKILTFFLKF